MSARTPVRKEALETTRTQMREKVPARDLDARLTKGWTSDKKPATVSVPKRALTWLLKYAQEERDVDHNSNYTVATSRVEPATVRRRIERFDLVAAELRSALGEDSNLKL